MRNYLIVPPPEGDDRDGIEAPGPLLGRITSNLFLELTFEVEVDSLTGVNNVMFLSVNNLVLQIVSNVVQ